MLRHAVRRLLWTIPALIGVSILSFWFLSYVPDLTDDPAFAAQMPPDEIVRLRRERFVDLPRFLNFNPRDVRTRATAAVKTIAEGGEGAPAAERELARLGGAALPHVLPVLDALAPEPRERVAVALAPVAARMRLASEAEAEDPTRAVALWTRFWDDRGVEFRSAAVRSAVQRLMRYGTESREAELKELDTFALEHVLLALQPPTDPASLQQARSLIDIAAHVTGSSDRIEPGDNLDQARAVVDRWRAFWNVYRSDFTVFTGTSRVIALMLETRYGKWALGAITHDLGLSSSGESVQSELSRRAPVTLGLLFGAIALAYAAALPLGVLTAASRGRKSDLMITSVILGLYTVPTAVLAVFIERFAGPASGDGPSLILPTAVLALGLIAGPTRQLRSKLAIAIGQDFFRAVLARGSGRMHAIVTHGLRNSLLPFATLAALEPPLALGGAFVVEHAFRLHGLGEATIRAVQQRDLSWLMALSIGAAATAAVGVIVTDLSYVLIDPRLSEAVLARKS